MTNLLKITVQKSQLFFVSAMILFSLTGYSCSSQNTSTTSEVSTNQEQNNEPKDYASRERKYLTDINESIETETLTETSKFYYEQGREQAKDEKFKDAAKSFSRAIKRDPKFMDAYEFRGLAFSTLTWFGLAIDDFTVVINANPDDADSLEARGNAYLQQHNYNYAIRDFDRLIDLNKKNTNAYALRAGSYMGIGEYDRALDDLNIAIKLEPNKLRFYQARTLLADKTSRYENFDSDLAKIGKLQETIAEDGK